MKAKSLHDLAVRLCEGGTVWYEGHSLVAIEIPPEMDVCNCCHLDSICNPNIRELCIECDSYDGKVHVLNLWGRGIKKSRKRE